MGKLKELKDAGEELYECMVMQLRRENGEFHIPAETALFMWTEAMYKWKKAIGEEVADDLKELLSDKFLE